MERDVKGTAAGDGANDKGAEERISLPLMSGTDSMESGNLLGTMGRLEGG